MYQSILRLVCVIAIMGCSIAAHANPALSGTYKLDPHHTSVVFRIRHMDFSTFVGRFDKVEGSLDYDATHPENSRLDITVDVNSIDTNIGELDDTLRAATWFDTLKYPRATFHATGIKIIGDNHGEVTGDFTLHNVTNDLVLDTQLTGSGHMPFSDVQVLGFSATASFPRSAYGISNLEPLIGDMVTLQIDAEFDAEPSPR